MILTCPACGTQYAVKDGAIPAQGRQVRCASCKHSWHQDPETAPGETVTEAAPEQEEMTSSSPEPVAPVGSTERVEQHGYPADFAPSEDAAADVPLVSDGTAPETSPVEQSGEPEWQPAQSQVPNRWNYEVIDEAQPVDDFDNWTNSREIEQSAPRRGLRTLLLLVVIIAALAIAAWFLAPREWMARAGLREASADSPLQLMVTAQDRQKLASGNDLVSLSGRVINPTDNTLTVPPLQADLRDGGGKLVYSWTIAPPARRLPPRGSASFNAAELGVPSNATSLTLRWAS